MRALHGAAVVLLIAPLAGCQSSAEYFADECAARGIAAGSPELQQCVTDRERELEETRAVSRRAGGGGPNSR